MFKSNLKVSKKQLSLLVVDMLMIWLSIELGYLLRLGIASTASLGYVISNIFIYVIIFYIVGLYDFQTDFRRKKELINIVVSIGAATLAIITVLDMWRFFTPGRGIFFSRRPLYFWGY